LLQSDRWTNCRPCENSTATRANVFLVGVS
jgi:hypothetical protein